ncbi:hypothetical protein CCZ01_02520 [Helicobacter monodelphidis]|uniref:hypothetical protein n=1 Tax=Helicobacter sp. 15-1451 TaxID=2004995 RepID=UPI000DCC6143|nr:hypothetical protein [Helicobacter sp. 15-1451]RAX58675.1 hypothetical protein CCZ01_02520 [Helicobacter sp. 15-1451]
MTTKPLNAYLLLQILIAFIILSSMLLTTRYLTHRISGEYISNQASAQLAQYAKSSQRIIVALIQNKTLKATKTPTTNDTLFTPFLTPNYHISFNLWQVSDFLICIETYVNVILPNGTLLNHHDSALLYQEKLISPALKCDTSITP